MIRNEGEKKVKVQTEEGHVCSLTVEITGVNKTLLSVSKVCDAGHEVLFTRDGGKTVRCESGQTVHFKCDDGAYGLQFKVIGEAGTVFHRPGK